MTVEILIEADFITNFHRIQVYPRFINLEQKAEGLIAQILGVNVAEVQGEA